MILGVTTNRAEETGMAAGKRLAALIGAGVTCWVFLLGTPAGAEPVYTLRQLLDMALKQNPGLQVAEYEVRSLETQVLQKKAGWLPQVSADSYGSRLGEENKTTTGESQYWEYQNVLSATQLIYDFGKTSGGVRQSERSLQAGKLDHRQTISDLVRDLKLAYYEVLKKKRLWQVARASTKARSAYHEQAQALFEAGLRPRAYATKTMSELAQAQLDVVQAEYDIKLALADLERVLGGPPARGPYGLKDIDRLPKFDFDLASAANKALENRPDLKSLSEQAAAAKASQEALQGDYWPTISGKASYKNQAVDTSRENTWQMGLTLSWSLFNGRLTSSRISQAGAQVMKLESQMRSQLLEVNRQVAQAYYSCQKAYKSIGVAKKSLEYAKDNLEMAEERFRGGSGDAIELSDAVDLHTQAENDKAQATYNYLKALADLDHAMGAMP
jgi:outer membrane protein